MRMIRNTNCVLRAEQRRCGDQSGRPATGIAENRASVTPDFTLRDNQTHNEFSRRIEPAITVPSGSGIEAFTDKAMTQTWWRAQLAGTAKEERKFNALMRLLQEPDDVRLYRQAANAVNDADEAATRGMLKLTREAQIAARCGSSATSLPTITPKFSQNKPANRQPCEKGSGLDCILDARQR